MGYQTQRDRISKFFEDRVLPSVMEGRDLDFYKTRDIIASELVVSPSLIEDTIGMLVRAGKLKEVRILTIPDEKIGFSLNLIQEREEQRKELREEADSILKEHQNVSDSDDKPE